MSLRATKIAGYLILILVVLALPSVIRSDYYVHICVMTAINVMLTSSLRLMATTGQLSIGHTAFMSIGAYASAVLVMKAGLSTYAALPVAAALGLIVAAIVAFPFTRVRTVYFAMLSMFFCQVVVLVMSQARALTGGTTGIADVPGLNNISLPGLVNISFSGKAANYYFAVVLTAVMLAFLFSIDRSYMGYVFKAIGQDETLSRSVGINPTKIKVLSFCIAGCMAAVAGSFYAHYIRVITPDSFGFLNSIYLLIYLLFGGRSRFSGAILGAVILTIVPSLFSGLKEYQPFLFVGVLYVVMFAFPEGLVALGARIKGRAVATVAERSTEHA